MNSLGHIVGQILAATAVLSGIFAAAISQASSVDYLALFRLVAVSTFVPFWSAVAALFLVPGISRFLGLGAALVAMVACGELASRVFY